MVGSKITARGALGTVIEWTPLTASLCDALVLHDDGFECWYASHELKSTDNKPLPSREAACEEARTKTIQTLRSIRNDLVQEVKSGRPWPGMEFGKSHLGMAVTKALETLEEGYSEQAIPWKEIHNSIC